MLKKICDPETEIKKKNFYCEKCDYNAKTKFLYFQHCKTIKHKKQECSKMLKKYETPHICSCGRKYKHIQSSVITEPFSTSAFISVCCV